MAFYYILPKYPKRFLCLSFHVPRWALLLLQQWLLWKIIELQCNTQESPNKLAKIVKYILRCSFFPLTSPSASIASLPNLYRWVYQKLSQLITSPWDSVVRTSCTHTHTHTRHSPHNCNVAVDRLLLGFAVYTPLEWCSNREWKNKMLVEYLPFQCERK